MLKQLVVSAVWLGLLESQAAAAPTIAMNGHLPLPADSVSMAQLGVRTVRMDFNWQDFEPSDGTYTFGSVDSVVDAARANGLSIYASLGYTPDWAAAAPCTPGATSDAQRCGNKRPVVTKWTRAVTAVVTHYRGKVDCWGLWNEPNLRQFFDGTLQQFVDEVFLPGVQALRAADPTARVCGPELAGLASGSNWNGKNGTCVAGSCIRNGWELDLGQMLDRVGAQLDVITQHTYQADAPGVMRYLLDGDFFGTLLTHDSARHVIEAHGQGHKEFWLTETGWQHGPGQLSLNDVATRIVDLYAKQEEVCAGTWAGSANDPWPNWTRTFYFHFNYDSDWGVVGPNQSPLAPYTALQSWAAGRTTTACTGPQGADAGAPPADAGVRDAGTATDAGAASDSGTPTDPADAGSETPDAGLEADAGNSAADGGQPGASDAGTTPGGPTDPSAGGDMMGGCGCAGVADADLLAVGLAAMATAARRRRGR